MLLLLILGQVAEVMEAVKNRYSQTVSTIPLNALTSCSMNFNLLMKMQDMKRIVKYILYHFWRSAAHLLEGFTQSFE